MKNERILFHFLSIFVVVAILAFTTSIVKGQSKPSSINLSGVTDYSTELLFTDIFKMSREWITFNNDFSGPWDTQQTIPVNEAGYPLRIPFNAPGLPPQQVRTVLLWDINGHYPSGEYRLIVEGKGRVSMRFAVDGVWETPCDVRIPIMASDLGIIFTIEESDSNDPISDIKLILPAYADNYREKIFTDDFLEFVSDFDNIRFMDWTETNFSEVRSWSDRGLLDYYTQTTHSGVAWEYVIQLCNLLGKDPWINIPHAADDDYIEQLAIMFRDQLNPNLKIYLEYSNEVWNGIFTQHQYASQQGTALGYSGDAFVRGIKYTVKRSSDIFYIFNQVFGDQNRIYNVLPSWIATDGWYSNELLSHIKDPIYNPHNMNVHGIAVAPYFGGEVAEQIVNQGIISTITIDEIMQRLDISMDWVFGQIEINKQIAEENEIELIAYEGGQHLVANWPHTDNDELTAKLIEANRHPEMENLYCKYTDFWYETTGNGLFSFFSSHILPGRWGSWGIKEHMDDFDNPKYKAIKECVLNTGSTSASEVRSKLDIVLSPNPATDKLFIQNLEESIPWKVFSIDGRICLSGMGPDLSVSQLTPGMYFLKIQDMVAKFVKL